MLQSALIPLFRLISHRPIPRSKRWYISCVYLPSESQSTSCITVQAKHQEQSRHCCPRDKHGFWNTMHHHCTSLWENRPPGMSQLYFLFKFYLFLTLCLLSVIQRKMFVKHEGHDFWDKVDIHLDEIHKAAGGNSVKISRFVELIHHFFPNQTVSWSISLLEPLPLS